jgi:hypothetical protein
MLPNSDACNNFVDGIGCLGVNEILINPPISSGFRYSDFLCVEQAMKNRHPEVKLLWMGYDIR